MFILQVFYPPSVVTIAVGMICNGFYARHDAF